MKRTFACFLAVMLLVCAVCIPAYADTDEADRAGDAEIAIGDFEFSFPCSVSDLADDGIDVEMDQNTVDAYSYVSDVYSVNLDNGSFFDPKVANFTDDTVDAEDCTVYGMKICASWTEDNTCTITDDDFSFTLGESTADDITDAGAIVVSDDTFFFGTALSYVVLETDEDGVLYTITVCDMTDGFADCDTEVDTDLVEANHNPAVYALADQYFDASSYFEDDNDDADEVDAIDSLKVGGEKISLDDLSYADFIDDTDWELDDTFDSVSEQEEEDVSYGYLRGYTFVNDDVDGCLVLYLGSADSDDDDATVADSVVRGCALLNPAFSDDFSDYAEFEIAGIANTATIEDILDELGDPMEAEDDDIYSDTSMIMTWETKDGGTLEITVDVMADQIIEIDYVCGF